MLEEAATVGNAGQWISCARRRHVPHQRYLPQARDICKRGKGSRDHVLGALPTRRFGRFSSISEGMGVVLVLERNVCWQSEIPRWA